MFKAYERTFKACERTFKGCERTSKACEYKIQRKQKNKTQERMKIGCDSEIKKKWILFVFRSPCTIFVHLI